MTPQKTVKERILHSVLFEVGGLLVIVPLAAWVLDKKLVDVGGLGIMLTTLALLWNMLFNAGFEHLERAMNWTRTVRIRVLHTLLFEGGLILGGVPLAAWWLNMSLIGAFLVDVGLFLAYLPYTFCFNWLYDHLRDNLVARRQWQTT
ncbi:multidrug/biocide efflux PACE transporter [Chitinivorax sp. B]|uniref:multidrug/biocide efflux PACE transporter n=1 Tax=Chitinivorax sp. B TaxID=2502235 RepID=UPI0010F976E3|nr:multidrug/biocide efflux PACE transporter [Chitinivorax sp. B]